MNANRKRHICFFLDYGCCLWDADGRDPSCLWPYEEILSSQTRTELEIYMREFNASYDYGLPPYGDFTVEDCRRFNRETRRIFALIIADTKDNCIVCNDQFELTEDEEVLIELRQRGRDFINEWREKTYLWSQVDWGDDGWEGRNPS